MMKRRFVVPGEYVNLLLGVLVLSGLYLTSRYSYLLFHSLAETFSVVVACCVFILAWNSRRFLDNDYLLSIGIASLFVAGLDLVHTLAYKGMGVFPGYDANLPTQLWIAARYFQSLSLLIAPLFLRRNLKTNLLLLGYTAVTFLLLGSIFYWKVFPDCYIEGVGLTPFKKISEYAISLILLASAALLLRHRREFDGGVLRLLVWSIVVTIGAELTFTFYIGVYGFFNLVGHFFKIVAFYLIYKAIVETGFTKPYNLLFRGLQQTERRFRRLFEGAPVMYVITRNQGGVPVIADCNESFLDTLGYTRAETLGQPLANFYTPESRVELLGGGGYQQALEGCLAVVERRLLTRDGRVVETLLRAVPEVDTDGNVSGTRAMYIDIAERKQAEEALRQLNATLEARVRERTAELQAQYARLDAILSSTTDGIVVTDREGNITRANPVAQTWLAEILSPEDAERLQEAVRDLAMVADERPEMVLELTQQDLEVSAAPVVGESAEEPSAAVVDIHDISPFKALDRMKTTFINNVAHELRTPVSTIKSYAYLMQRTPSEDEKWGQYLVALVQETDQQVQLVEDIMQISRIYTGQLEIEPRPTPLTELTEVVVTSHRALARERGVTLEHRPMKPAPVALADPKQMLSALNHLVGDAIRYTPEGGQVVVSTGRREAEGCVWAVVAVSDTGEVIPAEDLPHVFERFFREEELRSVRVSETGLRLMIVKGIVELHSGRVTVESGEGMGSTFTIWLPMAD
jgi:PAS domain S-box-containing protein